MKSTDFSELNKRLRLALEDLESLSNAEASLHTNGTSSTQKVSLYVGGKELLVTHAAPEHMAGYRTVRGREMIILGAKKLLQGRIQLRKEEIARIRQTLYKELGDL